MRRTVTVDVQVDMDQIDTEDLVDELKERSECAAQIPYRDELIGAVEALRGGRIADGLSLLERLIWPKWQAVDQCVADFGKAKRT